MTNLPITTLRLIPRDSEYLDRKLGSRGEIFFDQTSNTLRLYDGVNTGGIKLAKANLTNVSNSDFLAKATAAGVGTTGNTTVTVSSTTPSGPSNGNLWLNTDNGRLYVYVNDGTSSQWMQPASPLPVLTGYATETFVATTLTSYATQTYVNTAISAIPEVDLSFYATQSLVDQKIANIPPINVAGDDSTLRTINFGNTIKFTGAGGVTVTTDADGAVTITGSPSSSIGNLNIVGNVIDSQDSSSITFTPAVIFNSDVTIENELTVSNQVTANAVSAKSIYTEEFVSTIGVPTIYSETNINLSASAAVIVNRSPFRLAQFTSTSRNALAAINGDMIYNTTTNKVQAYAGGTWVDLH
jgi:hypothetical protein